MQLEASSERLDMRNMYNNLSVQAQRNPSKTLHSNRQRCNTHDRMHATLLSIHLFKSLYYLRGWGETSHVQTLTVAFVLPFERFYKYVHTQPIKSDAPHNPTIARCVVYGQEVPLHGYQTRNFLASASLISGAVVL